MLIADVVEEDRREICEELSRASGVPATSVFRILTSDLMKRKKFARCVPHCRTEAETPGHRNLAERKIRH